jgi:hypothetical protein
MSFASAIAERTAQPASKYVIIVDNQNDGRTD